MVVVHAYANFYEMYKRAMKIAWVIDETEAENTESGQMKIKFHLHAQRLMGIKILKDSTFEELKIRENNLYNNRKKGSVTVVIVFM